MIRLTVVTVLIVMLTLVTVYIIHLDKPCCETTIERISDDQYIITWKDNLSDDTYTTLVEVEYPDEDMTPEEELQLELGWTLQQFKDICHTHHK